MPLQSPLQITTQEVLLTLEGFARKTESVGTTQVKPTLRMKKTKRKTDTHFLIRIAEHACL